MASVKAASTTLGSQDEKIYVSTPGSQITAEMPSTHMRKQANASSRIWKREYALSVFLQQSRMHHARCVA